MIVHPQKKNIHGLYAIADTSTIDEALLYEKVRLVLSGGCSVMQYRDKSRDEAKRLRQAMEIRQLCSDAGAIFIINDDAELAMQVHADGVHCGKNDAPIIETRRRYPELLIGATCYNSLERAEHAVNDGADYLAFGSFYPSPSKPEATPADIQTLQVASQRFDRPIVAIGGIMVENAPLLISSGASAVAVINSVFAAVDPCRRSQEFCALFKQHGRK